MPARLDWLLDVDPARAGMIQHQVKVCPRQAHVDPARAGMILHHGVCQSGCLRRPRASGDDPSAASSVRPSMWVDPARAGMIRPHYRPGRAGPRRPRASGDDPILAGQLDCPVMSTPRERG